MTEVQDIPERAVAPVPPVALADLGRRARLIVAVLVLAAVSLGFVGVGADAGAPDFARRVSPERSLFSVAGGTNDRPLLVVHVAFSDVRAPAGGDYAEIVFGDGFGSVADYFRRQSFGRLVLAPAPETQGTADDGVVSVTLGPVADYARRGRSGPPAIGDEDLARAVLEAIDPHVDFARFDRDGDGLLSADELLIVAVRVTAAENCGFTGRVTAGPPLDGMDLSAITYSEVASRANRITIAHEISHQALGSPDYGYTEGRFDPHGPTCALPDDTWWGYGAWRRLHLGWITPTVVTRDGFYSVARADRTGQAFVLHDPSRGRDDYLLVENRLRAPGTYDQDIGDSGLVVWRVDERRYARGPTALVSPRPGATAEAWDPSDPGTPQRNLTTTTWSDGSPAAVAIRAIGPAGPTVRAYFDVPGPGILIDAPTPAPARVAGGGAGALPIQLENTGEATDTFELRLSGLPAGWASAPRTARLAAQERTTAPVALTPAAGAAGAAPGLYPLTARARSLTDPAVTSTTTLSVRVR